MIRIIISDSSNSPPQENLEQLNPRLSSYRTYLQSRYRTMVSISSTQWPPVQTMKVFKLAMIQKERIQRGRINDDFIRMSITGKVDDILQHKTPIDIENIFTNCGDKRRFVLIEGAPGSGKSTLALHICQEWAKGKLFQEYDIVILVRLKDPHIREAKTVADLLPCADEAMAKEAETAMKAQFGRGVLWVLDGWDELPSDLPIIRKLILPETFRESPLHQSTVIVTSRPLSSAELHPLVSSRVEVLGFTPHELEQYFKECLQGDARAVHTLLERIRENPVVESSCYLPLNAAIVAHVFLSSDHSLPKSNHEIFTEVVKSSLKRYLQDRRGITISVGNITSPNSLPSEIRIPVKHLCRLAFYGIESNKLTFNESDLSALTISKGISEYGLLQSVPSMVSDGHQIYFCFLHLSIQELLAAVHITYMSPKKQISVFQELFGTPQFNTVFQFYAGFTKLRVSRPFLNKLPRFLCPMPTSVYNLLKKIVKKEVKKNQNEKPLLVFLLHCLYEAEESSLCMKLAGFLDHCLNLAGTTLAPLNCLSVGYFVSVTSSVIFDTFRIKLQDCSISDQGSKFLVRGLRKRLNTQSEVPSQLCVDLEKNDLHDEGVHHIAQLLEKASDYVVRKLDLSKNLIGKSGLRSLCNTLSTNTTLEVLDLYRCSLTISEENGLLLYQLLSTNKSLRVLDLSGNTITNCCQIAAGLSSNETLRTLKLQDCDLTDQSLEELNAGLNNHIRELYINVNRLTENGLLKFARNLSTLTEMRHLEIPYHLGKSINLVFSEANEERNELPEIRVEGECDSLYSILSSGYSYSIFYECTAR